MTRILFEHRAVWGLVSVLAMAALVALPSSWPAAETGFWLSRLTILAFGIAGIVAIGTSPYWKIIYREAPLQRAITGRSDPRRT